MTGLSTGQMSPSIWKLFMLSDKDWYRPDEDNFWSMGDGPGPCGPCTEIFWDQLAEIDGERFLEQSLHVDIDFSLLDGLKILGGVESCIYAVSESRGWPALTSGPSLCRHWNGLRANFLCSSRYGNLLDLRSYSPPLNNWPKGVRENYDIDTLRELIGGTRQIIHDKFGRTHQPHQALTPKENAALKVNATTISCS